MWLRLAVLCVLSSLVVGVAASHALTGATIGAIYWPAWSSGSETLVVTSNYRAQSILSRASLQSKAPWYCTSAHANKLYCIQTQAQMDKEIQLAATFLNYWAFFWYGAASGNVSAGSPDLQRAWDLYQASAYNTTLKWSLNMQLRYLGANPWSDTAGWQANVDTIVTHMGQSTYQKVGGRPLLFLWWLDADVTTYFAGSQANLATAIAYLRTQAATAGVGDPYVVVQRNGKSQSSIDAIVTAIGADVLGEYGGGVARLADPGASTTYATQDALVQANWTTLSGTHKIVIPLLIGRNACPRLTNPPQWEAGTLFPYAGMNLCYAVGTPAAIAAGQVTAAGVWADANPTKHDKVFLIYSWTEYEEGEQPLGPTRGDPPQSDPPYTPGQSSGLSALLNAVGPVLHGYR